MSSKVEKLLIWSISSWVIFSGLWGLYFTRPFPVPGLSNFSSFNPTIKWSVIAAIVTVSTLLTIKRWHTRDRLIIFQGIVLTLSVIVLFFIDMTVGFAFIVFYKFVTDKISRLQFKGMLRFQLHSGMNNDLLCQIISCVLGISIMHQCIKCGYKFNYFKMLFSNNYLDCPSCNENNRVIRKNNALIWISIVCFIASFRLEQTAFLNGNFIFIVLFILFLLRPLNLKLVKNNSDNY